LTNPTAAQAVGQIRAWGEARNWKGFDPYDALNSPYAPGLTLGTRLGRQALTQAVKLSPLNLRRPLGIPPEWNAKALGLVASAYARLSAVGDDTADAEAERWLKWLARNHSGDDSAMGWGYHFDVQTRFFAYPRGTPNTIATSFVAQAFLDGAELLGEERWMEQAIAGTRYLKTHMLADGKDGKHFRYLPCEDILIHNANLLACAVMARAGKVCSDGELVDLALESLETSLAAQREDGSWPYGEGKQGNWVDNFHTGYVLESLAHCVSLGPEIEERLDRGLDYWHRELFLDDGTPRYAPGQTYPLDAHCYATAIDTWLAVANHRPEALGRAERIAGLLIDRMLDSAGFVCFQQRRFWTNCVPFVRWTTAPSFRALAGLLLLQRNAAGVAHAHLD
jgi:hypothetical protein